jgi:regulator of protease activity HflC (stomatin/prohibitin superfamily)
MNTAQNNLFETLNSASQFIIGLIFLYILIKFVRSIRVVPTKSSYIVERFGKYHRTLEAGFHTLLPFIDEVSFIQDLREVSIVVEPQECFTNDNVQVEVDGVLYISVVDPVKASYGVTDFRYAATQLVQTTTRSVIGQIDLDKTFEERDLINNKVSEVLSEVEPAWGIKVHRYEVKNIEPPKSVRHAMERQMTAEREKRAIIAQSEGEKTANINESEGKKAEMVNRAQGVRQRIINEAEGKAQEILSISKATAESILRIAQAVSLPHGEKALKMRLSRSMIEQLSNLENDRTRVMLPKDLSSIDSWLEDINKLKKSTNEA